MANYYSDHPEIGFYLNHPLMARIVELKEKGFADAKEYDYAPVDLGDAIENYKQILDITGDVAANIIEPNSESVDLEGPHLENGRMIYASKTYANHIAKSCTNAITYGRTNDSFQKCLYEVHKDKEQDESCNMPI